MKRNALLLFPLVVLVITCLAVNSYGYVDKEALRHELRTLYELLSRVESADGPLCTPEELARAQAYLTQASREFDEGDYWEAEDYMKLAKTASDELLKKIPGCREDTDHDGIPDDKDRCPKDPENYNGYQDEDGCPDHPPERAVLTPEKIELLEAIQFDEKTYQVLPVSEAVLKDVSGILIENQGLRIRVEAHMDNRLPPEEARRITLEWAMAVKKSLVSHGIKSDRIDAQGKGSSEPIAPNTNRLGREMNQRIEFIRLPVP